ncbi:Protein of unknown function (DUF2795) [Candidatus Kryptobacter tengchongensis]|nr:Protein of unknown function (DUF2795) [Candidatus Kryptobacter tengchongensis]
MEVDRNMLWTPELIRYLEGAPWPATKQEIIEYAKRIGAPPEVIQNLEELEDSDEEYNGIEDIWPDYSPEDEDDYLYGEEDEY